MKKEASIEVSFFVESTIGVKKMPNVIIRDDMHKRNPYNEKNGIAAAFSCSYLLKEGAIGGFISSSIYILRAKMHKNKTLQKLFSCCIFGVSCCISCCMSYFLWVFPLFFGCVIFLFGYIPKNLKPQ